jgi:putative intracellular protease/amidase
MSSTESLTIGGIVFEDMDQADFTGPFEVLSRVTDSVFHVIGKTNVQVRDVKGLILTPSLSFAQSPQLDVLLVPGGNGVMGHSSRQQGSPQESTPLSGWPRFCAATKRLR